MKGGTAQHRLKPGLALENADRVTGSNEPPGKHQSHRAGTNDQGESVIHRSVRKTGRKSKHPMVAQPGLLAAC
jgi:hypothetical protein